MASTGSTAKDRSRLYKPVYAALKEQDIRTAVRLCDRKDIAQTPLAKALKAQALLMGGYGSDARNFALESVAKTRGGPVTDPVVLISAARVLFRVGEASEAIRAYEEAVAAAPDNEALGRGLCLECARAQEWKKLQAAAMRLYGKHPKPLYMAWAALAVHLTAGQSELPDGKVAPNPATGGGRGLGSGRLSGAAAVPLSLAERMLSKALDQAKPEDRDADSLGLYLHSLVRQGKAGEAYAALMGRYAYLPPADAAASPASSTGTEATDALAIATAAAEEELEDAEAAAESAAEEFGSVAVLPDGKGGRGRVPGPLQPEDQLRYAAQLLAWRAAWGPGANEASPLAIPEPTNPAWRVCDPTGGQAVGTWGAAKAGFGALLATFEACAGEWDVHSGVAYCWAQETAAALSSGSGANVSALLAPVLTADGSDLASSITGVPAVDGLLVKYGWSNSSGGVPASPLAQEAGTGSETSLNTRRACAAALILHQAVRCELAHRLATSSGPASEAAKAALAAGTVAYTRLVASFVSNFGSKPSVFSDLKALLVPFAREASGPATASGAAGAGLTSFLGPEATIISTPYLPVSQPGSAAESAPTRALFSWSFSVPSADVATHLVPLLQKLRADNRPDEKLSSSVKTALAEGRAAAVAAGLVDKSDVMVRTRDIKGGGKGSGSQRYDPRSPPEADPHGVGWALSARDEFVWSEAHKEALASARAAIRRYTTAMALLRYLGVTDLTGCAVAEGSGASTAGAAPFGLPGRATAVVGEHGLRAVANELSTSWEHTLHLLAASPAEGKDQGEGDDLILLAAHCLWDLTFAHAQARESTGGPGVLGGRGEGNADSTGPESTSEASRAHAYASRSYLLEASSLLSAAVLHSAHNAQLRLALARCYTWMAAPSAVLNQAIHLRLRYISWETLGHAVNSSYVRSYWTPPLDNDKPNSFGPQLVRWLGESNNARPDFVRTALRCGNVASAADLSRMKPRLENSASGAWARAVMLGTETNNRSGKSLQEVRQVLYSGVMEPLSLFHCNDNPTALALLRDNEDREVFSDWAQPSGLALAECRTGGLKAIAGLADLNGQKDKDGKDKIVGTSDVASAALALFGGSSTTAAAASELSKWLTGSAGGTAERLIRRVGRDSVITIRTEISKTLLFGLRVLSADGTPSSAKLACERLAAAFETSGLRVPGAASGPLAAPDAAATEACSSLEALYAASTKASGSESPSAAALRCALWGDWGSGSLAVVDTGISGDRPSIRVGTATALWHTLAALACLCDAVHSTAGAAAQSATVAAATGHLQLASTVASAVLAAVGSAIYEPAPVAAAGSKTSPTGSSPDAAGATAGSYCQPTTALGGAAALPAPHAVVCGGTTTTATGGGFRWAWAAESALAVQQMMGPVVIALNGCARHLIQLQKDSGAAASAAGGEKKGKGKDGKGKSSAAAAGDETKEAKEISDIVQAVQGLVAAVATAQGQLKSSAGAISTSLTDLRKSVKSAYSFMEQSLEVSILAVSAGWDVRASATGTVAAMRPDVHDNKTSKGGSKGKAGKDGSAAGVAQEDVAPTEPGALYVHTLSAGFRKAVRVESIEKTMQDLGGSVLLSLQDVEEATSQRLNALKALLK